MTTWLQVCGSWENIMPGGITGERYICRSCGEDIEHFTGGWVHTDPQPVAGPACLKPGP